MRSTGLVLGLSAGSVCLQEAIGSTFSAEERKDREGKEGERGGKKEGNSETLKNVS